MPPSTADIRQHLTGAYSDEELTTLCFDYFRDVYDNFAAGMTKAGKIQLLLDHCQRRDLTSSLLAALARDRPEQYGRRFGRADVAPGPAAPVRDRDSRQVFISHAHQDAEFAQRLAADLRAAGWRVWVAPDSIRPGEKWVDAINRGLLESGVCVLVLTPYAVSSEWVKTETNAAIGLAHKGRMRFLPVEVVSCEAPPLWEAYQWIPFAGRYDRGLGALLAAMDPSAPAVLRSSVSPDAERAAPNHFTITSPIHLELVRVPAGEFLMGSDPQVDKNAYDDEQPQHRLSLPEFYIGKYPVTVAQFAAFSKATRHKTNSEKAGYGWVWNGSKWEQVQGADWQHPSGPQSDARNKANHPVTQVSWHDALAFCRWLSAATGRPTRLPTEAEWEKAASWELDQETRRQGNKGRKRIWPWGDTFDEGKCNTRESGIGDTTPVDRYPAGASPCGTLDMAGNVWEWTGSLWGRDVEKPDFGYPYDPTDGREALDAPDNVPRGVRGGSWAYSRRYARCAVRLRLVPDDFLVFIGFRVVVSLSF